MEIEKRKRLNDVEVSGKKARAAAEEGRKSNNNPAAAERVAEEVAEEEVEEFFTILRRIHVAVKYFGKTNGEKTAAEKSETAVRPWNPAFRLEDFEERAEAETVMENNTDTGLDLNSEPDCQPTSPDSG